MYSLKKMTQKISKTYTLSFPKAAHSLEAQDQGVWGGSAEAGALHWTAGTEHSCKVHWVVPGSWNGTVQWRAVQRKESNV